MLAALATAVVSTGTAHAHALRDRFADPTPISCKASLQHALKLWRASYEELSEANCRPSRATALKSLRTLIGGVDELRIHLEILQITEPDDMNAILRLAESRAAEWAILAGDSRLAAPASANAHTAAPPTPPKPDHLGGTAA